MVEGATLSWSAASGVAPLTYGVYEATNSGGEVSALLNTNALAVFIPLYPGSNSAIIYFFKVNVVDGCSATDTNQVELSVQPLLDPTKSQVGDGIPNSWKLQYGFSPFDPTVAAADPDGDGLSNLQEFLLGTNPLDSTSPFRATGITLQGADVLITWSTAGGLTNAVESTADPAAPIPISAEISLSQARASPRPTISTPAPPPIPPRTTTACASCLER